MKSKNEIIRLKNVTEFKSLKIPVYIYFRTYVLSTR